MDLLAVAQPPLEMSTPDSAEQVVLTVLWTLVGAFVAGSVYLWWRTGKPTALLLTAGGAVCSLNESLVDVLGHCYFPADGWMAQEFFERPVPIWVVLGYVVFFGALVHVNAEVLKRRPSRTAMWIAIGAFWVANTLLELPILASDLYLYYGEQPLEVGGFPLVWLTINSLGSFAAAVVVVRFEPYFTGARQLLLLGVCFGTYMASWTLSMPYFWAVNSDVSGPVLSGAAILSMAFAAIAIDALIRLALRGPVTVARVPGARAAYSAA